MSDVELFWTTKSSKEERSGVSYLTEFREVVLLAEGTLPQARRIITDGLVIALSLRPPVSNTSYYTGDQLTWKKRREKPSTNQAASVLGLVFERHSFTQAVCHRLSASGYNIL